MKYRTEKDKIGEKKIPYDYYWGIHTERAVENFKISGLKVQPVLIKSIALVKKAAVMANSELGYIEKNIAEAIISACDDIIEFKLRDSFPLDPLQGGAGTSTNLNLNEVIANRALEILGYEKGRYDIISPFDTVNKHQSTNDVYPTALKIAVIELLRKLSPKTEKLQGALQRKEKEFSDIVLSGRTEMQPAVPVTFGIVFSSFADAVARDRWRIFKAEERIRVVNIGGTAVGTGIGAPKKYIFLVIDILRELCGFGISRGENLADVTSNADQFVEVSAVLKANASNLVKIADDLRRYNLLGEIKLEPVQSGSSIMPDKVNPVILESVMQGALKVFSNDTLVSDAACRGTFQINEFLPLLGYALLESLEILVNITKIFADAVGGITVNEDMCHANLKNNTAVITALVPHYGYEACEKAVSEFLLSQENDFISFIESKFGHDAVEKIISPYKITALGYRDE